MKTKKEVMEVYEGIAESWDRLRKKPYDEFYDFLNEVTQERKSGFVIDIGCGNGKNGIEFAKRNFDVICVDLSKKMVEIARRNAERNGVKIKFVVADACALPFKDNSFDISLSIATIHHIPKDERIIALNEMKRVMKNNGIGFISVWNRNQLKFFKKCFLEFLKGRDYGDVYIPWKTEGKTFYRFYHLFSKGELKKEILKSGLRILRIYPDKKSNLGFLFSGNIFAKIKK
jgi:ubiquinone/menaquinone biosynthesis C-methylase UbiE